ncbi:MAG: type IV secretion protein Rhs [Bermanella sp.]
MVLTYDYDANGNRTQVKTSRTTGGEHTTTVDYGYDALNRLTTVTDNSGTTTYTYDKVGNQKTVTYANGIVTEYIYNDVNQLENLITKNANGDVLSRYTYELDNTGRRESITEEGGRYTDYTYDNLYRLTDETITDAINGNYRANYQYDWVGNRTYETVDGVSTAYSYDLNDRLTSQGGTTYTYDANGNTLIETLDGNVTTYLYDHKNKLTSVEKSGVQTTYSYNVNGIRDSKTEGGVTTSYVVDSNRDYAQVLEEVVDGLSIVTYSYGHDLISQNREGDFRFYQYDGLGSTRELTDSSGAVTDSYDYEAFGDVLNETGGTDNNYKFTGEQFDTGLNQYYLRARYYDQGVGRFTQQDTWMGNNHDPITLNKYVYGNADPVSYIDPTGNWSLGSAMSSINIMSNLVSTVHTGYNVFQMSSGDDITAKDVAIALIYQLGASRIKSLKLFSKSCKGNKKCGPPVLGGRFRDVNKWRKQHKKGGEVHHIPAKSAVKTHMSGNASPAIWMKKEDHQKTASHTWVSGSRTYWSVQKSLLNGDKWCKAIQMDVDDIRSKFHGKYEGALIQMKLQLPVIIGKSCAF